MLGKKARHISASVHSDASVHNCILIFTYPIKIIDLNSNSIFIIEEKEYHARHLNCKLIGNIEIVQS